jgi:hypothetical protein
MLASQIKTASDLRSFVELAGTAPHFFDRKTMRFFGDTMANFGVRRVTVYTQGGNVPRRAFELYRRRPVKNGLQSSHYFAADTFEKVHGAYSLGWEPVTA